MEIGQTCCEYPTSPLIIIIVHTAFEWLVCEVCSPALNASGPRAKWAKLEKRCNIMFHGIADHRHAGDGDTTLHVLYPWMSVLNGCDAITLANGA